jgi:hypothetical protein
MVIKFKKKTTQRECEDLSLCIRKYGEEVAYMVFHKIAQLRATKDSKELQTHLLLELKPIEKNSLTLYTVELNSKKFLTFSVYQTVEIDDKLIEVVEIHDIK